MSDMNSILRGALQVGSPRTHDALTHMVPAMENTWRKAGKKSFFGGDLGAKAFAKFLATFKTALLALYDDGLVSVDDEWALVLEQLNEKLELFALAYPNWPDAYKFAKHFFVEEHFETHIEVFTEAREWKRYLELPMINRGPSS